MLRSISARLGLCVLLVSVQLALGFVGRRKAPAAVKALQITDSPCIILVNPFLDENVGQTSRIMRNFGLSDLRIVDPICDILSDRARLCAGEEGLEVLTSAKTYSTLQECIKDLQNVMATTIRPRHMTQIILSPSTAAEKCVAKGSAKTGIMFGRERSGLNNEEIALADSIISISTFKMFSSLNLAQAVNIMCYEVWKAQVDVDDDDNDDDQSERLKKVERMKAKREEVDELMQNVQTQLDAKGYKSNPFDKTTKRKELSYRHLRNILLRTDATTEEVDILRRVLVCLAEE